MLNTNLGTSKGPGGEAKNGVENFNWKNVPEIVRECCSMLENSIKRVGGEFQSFRVSCRQEMEYIQAKLRDGGGGDGGRVKGVENDFEAFLRAEVDKIKKKLTAVAKQVEDKLENDDGGFSKQLEKDLREDTQNVRKLVDKLWDKQKGVSDDLEGLKERAQGVADRLDSKLAPSVKALEEFSEAAKAAAQSQGSALKELQMILREVRERVAESKLHGEMKQIASWAALYFLFFLVEPNYRQALNAQQQREQQLGQSAAAITNGGGGRQGSSTGALLPTDLEEIVQNEEVKKYLRYLESAHNENFSRLQQSFQMLFKKAFALGTFETRMNGFEKELDLRPPMSAVEKELGALKADMTSKTTRLETRLAAELAKSREDAATIARLQGDVDKLKRKLRLLADKDGKAFDDSEFQLMVDNAVHQMEFRIDEKHKTNVKVLEEKFKEEARRTSDQVSSLQSLCSDSLERRGRDMEDMASRLSRLEKLMNDEVFVSRMTQAGMAPNMARLFAVEAQQKISAEEDFEREMRIRDQIMERMKEEEQEKEKSERTDRFRRASAFGLAPRPSISASQADSGRRRSLFPTPQDGGAESVASRGTRGSIVDGTKRGLATTTGALSARSAPQSARTGPGGQRLSLTMTIPQVQDSSTPPRRRPSSARPAAVSSASPAMFSQSSQHNGPPGDPSVVLLSPNQRPSTSPAHVARREGGGVPPSSQQLEVPSADGQGSIQGQTGETKRQSLLAASEAGDSVAQVEQRATGQQCSEAAEGLTEAESVDLDVKFDRCGGLEGREEGPSDAHPQPLRAHPHPQFPSKLYESNHDAVVVAVKRDPKSESDTEVMAVGTAVFDRIKNFEASALNLSGNAADVEPQTAVEELGRGVRLCYEDAGSFILQLKGRNAAELVKGKTTPNGAAGGASGFSPRGSVGKRGDTRLGAAVDWEDEGGRDRAGTMFGGGSHPFSPTPGGTPMTSTRPVPLSSLFPHSVSLSPSGRPQSGASRRLQAPPAPPGSTASSRLDVRAARVNPTETGSVDPGPLNAAAATAAAAAAAVAAADSPAEAAGEEYRERVPLREREPTRPLEGGRAAREDGERSHPVLREDDLPPISLGQSRLASSTGKERDARAP